MICGCFGVVVLVLFLLLVGLVVVKQVDCIVELNIQVLVGNCYYVVIGFFDCIVVLLVQDVVCGVGVLWWIDMMVNVLVLEWVLVGDLLDVGMFVCVVVVICVLDIENGFVYYYCVDMSGFVLDMLYLWWVQGQGIWSVWNQLCIVGVVQ